MRFWLSVLCVVLMGHWWHAVAMPLATPAPPPMAMSHLASHHDHHASDDCCETSQPQPTVKLNCGSEHACCTLQPTPVTQLTTPCFVEASGQRHALTHKLDAGPLKDRLFKPPRATL
jgi:hypothetical protein